MITIIQGDILNAPIAEIICHQTNCIGKFGSGVAGAIRKRYPESYSLYKEYIDKKGIDALGTIQSMRMSDGRIICNMLAQASCGYDGKKYTDEVAFKKCLIELKEKFGTENIFAFPYKIGCGLGGGSWAEISRIFLQVMSDRDIKFYRI